MIGRLACPLPPPPVRKYAPCPNVNEIKGKVQSSLYNTVLQVFVSRRVNCLLLLFAGPSSGVVKHVLDNMNVVESYPVSGRFINAPALLTCRALTISRVAQLRSNSPLWSKL
jgi:hypothetical protein